MVCSLNAIANVCKQALTFFYMGGGGLDFETYGGVFLDANVLTRWGERNWVCGLQCIYRRGPLHANWVVGGRRERPTPIVMPSPHVAAVYTATHHASRTALALGAALGIGSMTEMSCISSTLARVIGLMLFISLMCPASSRLSCSAVTTTSSPVA